MLAEGADRARALGVVARPVRRVGTIEHGRLLAQRAVGIDQRARRQLLAAAACHQHLAFGDDRGGEIEHDRVLPLARNADAIGRGREPLLHAAERRHQQRARGVDEMHRHQPFGGGHFGPVADAADMAGIAQRDRRIAPPSCTSRCRSAPRTASRSGHSRTCRRPRRATAYRRRSRGSGWERRCPSSSSGCRPAPGSRRGCHGR